MIFCFLVIVGVLSKRRARALRTPTTPRPASASASAMTPTVRLSLNYCNLVGHVGPGGVPRPVDLSADPFRSVFSDEKKLSMAALSHTFPERLIEQSPLSAIIAAAPAAPERASDVRSCASGTKSLLPGRRARSDVRHRCGRSPRSSPLPPA